MEFFHGLNSKEANNEALRSFPASPQRGVVAIGKIPLAWRLAARAGWVGIYPRTADLPILSRCEVIAIDQHEVLVMAKHRVTARFL